MNNIHVGITGGFFLRGHRRFDFLDRSWNGFAQHPKPIFRDQHIVLDANPNIPELPGHPVIRSDVAPWFYSEHHAGIQGAPFTAKFIFARVVDVQA